MVTFSEARPTNQPPETIHLFSSRSVAQRQDTTVNELTQLFREHIARPSVDALTRSTRAEPWEGQGRLGLGVDELAGHFRSMAVTPASASVGSAQSTPSRSSQSVRSRSTITSLSPATSFSSLTAISPSAPTLGLRPRQVGAQVLTAADILDFGEGVEKAFTALRPHVSENVILKVKLISVIAQKDLWVEMFQEVGLSEEAAGLVSVILDM